MISVYIHIPFCESICTYCDFCKMFYDQKMVDSYLKALKKEIGKTYKGEPVKTIYIGGGTPSSLSIDELTELFDIIKVFKQDKLEEFTIEGNVESLTKDKLRLLKEHGVNRLSIGVQSFNKRMLKLLGRNHTCEMIKNVISESKEIGISNINLDMMYGINGQTMNDVKEDIDMFLKLDVPHVSFYSLILEPHTKLYINKFKEIDEDLNAKMYDYINKVLKNHKYHHYEISNYAKAGYEAGHNLVYWHNEHYYGFGLGASSFIGNVRYNNTRSLNQYLKGYYRLDEQVLSNREMMENEMILGLRLATGVDKKQFHHKYGQTIEEVFLVDKLIANSQLVDNNNFLYIPESKMFISNSILIAFIE